MKQYTNPQITMLLLEDDVIRTSLSLDNIDDGNLGMEVDW